MSCSRGCWDPGWQQARASAQAVTLRAVPTRGQQGGWDPASEAFACSGTRPPRSGPAWRLPRRPRSQGLESGPLGAVSHGGREGAFAWPGPWRAPREGGSRRASCSPPHRRCHRLPWGEAGVQVAGGSCVSGKARSRGSSVLGRERDAPGRTSAVTLGPQHWQLLRPPALTATGLTAEPGRGRRTGHRRSNRRPWDRQQRRARRRHRPPRVGSGSPDLVFDAPPAASRSPRTGSGLLHCMAGPRI